MFNIRKVAAGAVGLTLVAASLTACGSNTSDNTSSNGKTEIIYAIWDKIQQPGMQAIADEFMKENEDIKVKVQVTEKTLIQKWREKVSNLGVSTLDASDFIFLI